MIVQIILKLGYLILIKSLGVLNFGQVYNDAETETDFMFRGKDGELFYKGFVFMPISLIFWINKGKIIPVFIISTAVFFTLTRGFYLISIIGVIMYYYINNNSKYMKMIVILMTIILLFLIISFNSFFTMEDRAGGDEIRLITIKQVYDKINALSLILGHGLGCGVEIRPVHMENSYLEIFHKLGLVGLSFWIYLFYCIHKLWQSTKKIKNCTILYIGVVMLYIQSLFNPYINNPIGLGYLMIAYSIIRYYAHCKNNLKRNESSCDHSYI